VHAAVVRRPDRQHTRKLSASMLSDVGARDEPAHTVRDDHHAARTGRRHDRIDLAGELVGKRLDRCERRSVRQAVEAAHAPLAKIPRETQPHAGVAQHAVQQQHRHRVLRRRGIAQEQPVEHQPWRRAGERRVFAPPEAQRRTQAEANVARAARTPDPGDREVAQAQHENRGEIKQRQPDDPRQRRTAGRDPARCDRHVER